MLRQYFIAGILALFLASNVFAQASVRSSSQGNEAGDVTTHNFTLPATIENNDLVFCSAVTDGTPTITWDSTYSWTEIHEDSDTTATGTTEIFKADGTEDSDALTFSTGGNSQQSAWICLAIQDWGEDLANDVDCGTAATGASDSPDPPSVTPGWGADANNMYIAIEYNDVERTVSAYSLPDNNLNETSAGGGGVGVGVSSDILGGASQDPGTYTISVSDGWVAQTCVVEPAAGGNDARARRRR